MSKEISIIKLMDGSTVVGKVEYGTDCIEIEHPIELVSNPMNLGPQLGEQISLRPWMSISNETIFVVERIQIITIGSLGKDFESGYTRMVDAIYNQPAEWSGDLYRTGETENIDNLDIDILTDYADAIMKKKIH